MTGRPTVARIGHVTGTTTSHDFSSLSPASGRTLHDVELNVTHWRANSESAHRFGQIGSFRNICAGANLRLGAVALG